MCRLIVHPSPSVPPPAIAYSCRLEAVLLTLPSHVPLAYSRGVGLDHALPSLDFSFCHRILSTSVKSLDICCPLQW